MINLIVVTVLLVLSWMFARPIHAELNHQLRVRRLRLAEQAAIRRALTQPAAPRPHRSCRGCAQDDWRPVGGGWICAECGQLAPRSPWAEPEDPSSRGAAPPRALPPGEELGQP